MYSLTHEETLQAIIFCEPHQTIFGESSDDEVEQIHRNELLWYAIVPLTRLKAEFLLASSRTQLSGVIGGKILVTQHINED